MMTKNKYFNRKESIICLFMAILFVFTNSISTSPLYRLTDRLNDSYIFQIIGKYWNGNQIPYVNLFDHKGPLIFFINAIGYKITGNRYGVFLIQIAFMYITIVFTFRMFRDVFQNHIAFILTVISLVGISPLYQDGNLTEEYILPFLMMSFYFFEKWTTQLSEGYSRHKTIAAFTYGLTFGVAVMTRITNAIGICFIVLFVMIILIKNQEWKNLFQNMGSFIAGCLLILLPFIIYFQMHGILQEMWFGTIGFNIEYLINSTNFVKHTSLLRRIYSFLLAYSSYFMAFAGIYVVTKKKSRFIGIFMITTSAVTTFMLATGRNYEHYYMICLPYLVLSIIELKKALHLNTKFIWKLNARKIIMICLVPCLLTGMIYLIRLYRVFSMPESDSDAIYEVMLPVQENDSFVAWDFSPYLYLKYDIEPCYKYFILQPSQGNMSKKLESDIYKTFENGNAKWILVKDGTQDKIQDILDERYDIIKRVQGNNGELLLYSLHSR